MQITVRSAARITRSRAAGAGKQRRRPVGIWLSALSFLSAMAGFSCSPAEKSGPEETYLQAYKEIMNENYSEASRLLDEFVDRFPEDRQIDAVRYWRCYVGEKEGWSLIKSLRCYYDFITGFPASIWFDDAKSSIIRISRKLARNGGLEGKAIIELMKESADDDIALTALYALHDMGEEGMLDESIELFESRPYLRTRRRIVVFLDRMDTPESISQLIRISREAPEERIRREALKCLGKRGSSEAIEALKSSVYWDKSEDIQEYAAFLIADKPDDVSVPLLSNLAFSHPGSRVRRTALLGLGRKGTDAAVATLKKALRKTDDAVVRDGIILAIANIPDDRGLSLLRGIVRDHPDSRARREALFWLRTRAQEGSIPALEAAVLHDHSREVRLDALRWLSEMDDERADKATARIAGQHSDPSIRRQARAYLEAGSR